MAKEITTWLMESGEPWTRYRTQLDLLELPAGEPGVQTAREEMIAHPRVRDMIQETAHWGELPFKRHNDAGYPIYKFSTLADFGIRANDPGMKPGLDAVFAHQAEEGAFQSLVNIPKAFGGSGEDTWTWILCDTPTLLYALLSMGFGNDPRVERAVSHLSGLAKDNGWGCLCDPLLGKFRGPGKKADPCPIVNVFALKALSLVTGMEESRAVRMGVEMLLGHWQERGKRKFYLFGIGSDFHKLKYPYVWYNILHVVEVLSRFPFVHEDPRFREMIEAVTAQADEQGRYKPGSMYMTWKGWNFSDKKNPSPWLTFLVYRILKRIGA